MNDRQNPYGTTGPPPEVEAEFVGYDEYGRPLYQRPHYPQPSAYDPYQAAPSEPQPSGYDPYAPSEQSYGSPPDHGYQAQSPYDPYGAQPPSGYDPYAAQAQAPGDSGYPPPQTAVPPEPPGEERPYDPYGPAVDTGGVPRQRQPEVEPVGADVAVDSGDTYHTEQFSFVEDPDDDSEDVIDWLKFSESRTERRDERKRRGRHRITALVVLLVIALAGGVGYLGYAGKLPGLPETGGADSTAVTAQKRDVIAVHLREVDGGNTATALLVDNTSADRATTVLLPNDLAVSVDGDTTTTLGKAVDDEGAAPTRDALNTLLGAEIKGTWRLDTPYLENLVELVGGIVVDANTTVPARKKGEKAPVRMGGDRELDGAAAVAYATHRGRGEPQARQLERFGQVMAAVLRKLSSDPKTATATVRALGQVPDPSLSEPQLGASLAHLAQQAKDGGHRTELLPVSMDGTLSERAGQGLVKRILGSTVRNSDPDAAVRVGVTNASGATGLADQARITLVNGGYQVVGTGTADTVRTTSTVSYTDRGQAAGAKEVARTLGLPVDSVRRAAGASNADITVVLGTDFVR